MRMPAGLEGRDVSTPYLVVDQRVMQENISRVHGHLARLGVAVRPHAKTHKSPRVAERQVAGGATGLTVATVGEAEVFADAGYRDIFVAYPVWLDEDRARRLSRLADRCRLAVGVESAEGARQLVRWLDPRVEVMVEVDSGHHRTGCHPEMAGEVAAVLAGGGLHFRGVFTFPGHSYAPGAAQESASQEAGALERAAAAARAVGLEPTVVSGGSTPSVELVRAGVLTEVRPGVYVFNDAQQWELGRCAPEQVALTAHSRVVSARPGRVVLDAGSKILGADRAAYATGYGRLLDLPAARITQLSEHHAVVETPPGQEPDLGSLVRVVPNHVCTAVNLVDTLTALDGPTAEVWPVTARGANS